MRSKEDRRARHMSSFKPRRLPGGVKATGNREDIVQSQGKVYKKVQIDNQAFYVRLNTTKE